MGDDTARIDSKSAQDMLEVFASVGTNCFDLTLTNLNGDKIRFRRQLLLAALRNMLPELLAGSARLQHNVIVRPHAPSCALIQLDDLAAPAVERIRPAAFLVLETSPGNHQAWVAVPVGADGGDSDFARRLRKRAGADPTASGATRVVGSINFKEKYASHFPRIETRHTAPGRVSHPGALTALGLVAEPEAALPVSFRVSRPRRGRTWPSYELCVEGAPPNHGQTGPDISRADFT